MGRRWSAIRRDEVVSGTSTLEQDRNKVVERRLTVLEPNKLLRALTRALLVIGPVAFVGFTQKVFPPGILGIHLFVLSFVLGFAQRRHNLRASRAERDVKITPDGVLVDGALVVKKEQIKDGLFQPRPPRDPGKASSLGPSLRLYGKRKRILFEVEADQAEANEMLQVLGLDASHRRAQFSTASPLFATTGRNILFTWSMLALGAGIAMVLAAMGIKGGSAGIFVVLPFLFFGMLPQRVEVGVDGVLIRWMWQKRFIPMNQIRRVSMRDSRQVVLHLESGEEVNIYAAMPRSDGSFALQRRDALVARIREAQLVYQSRGPIVDVAALVGRGDRPRSEWVEALMKLRDQAGYREAVVRDEDLWRLVEDPAAPEDARAGAVMALRSGKGGLGEEGKARVRVAADATASPKLRVVLDAAVADSDEEAKEALHALIEQESERREG